MQKKRATSLLDVGQAPVVVQLGEYELDVHGLTVRDVFDLMVKFPAFRDLMERGKAGVVNPDDLSASDMLSQMPDAVYAGMAIAAERNKKKRQEVAEHIPTMSIADQLTLLEGVLEATFRGGVGPFVERLSRLTGTLGVSTTGEAAPPTGSTAPSPASLQLEEPPGPRRGTARRADSTRSARRSTQTAQQATSAS